MDAQELDKRRSAPRSRSVGAKRTTFVLALCVLLGLLGSLTLANAATPTILPHHPPGMTPVVTLRAALTPQPTPTTIKTPTTNKTPLPAPPAPIMPFPADVQQEIAVLQAHDRWLTHGNAAQPEVALTFDDGPNPYYTPRVLAVLQRYHVPATFFCVGYLVARYPQLVRQEQVAGYVVGDHSWSHPALPLLTPSQIRRQLSRTADTLQYVLGVRPTFFRPPYGIYDAQVLVQANRLGLTVVMWNDDPRDWSQPGTKEIITQVLYQAGNGSIILLHDGGGNRSQTVAALPTIITSLRQRGFTFVTLEELVQHLHGKRATSPTPPKVPAIIVLFACSLLAWAWRRETLIIGVRGGAPAI